MLQERHDTNRQTDRQTHIHRLADQRMDKQTNNLVAHIYIDLMQQGLILVLQAL